MNLSRLYGAREALFEAWVRAFVDQHHAGKPLLAREDLVAVFGRELERLSGPQPAHDDDAIEAALRATASCFAARGVPLAEVLTAASLAESAARQALGSVDEPLASDLARLERARMRAYCAAYLAHGETQPRSCSVGAIDAPLASISKRPGPANTYGMVGKSAAIRHVLELVEAAARGPATVLVTGESGTGKELVARAIHAAAGAGPSSFVAVNCAALPSALVESELFGHARGAFTGSGKEHPGLFRAAEGGTLFLDEISEMSTELQAKLLRVLEERTVRPVGSIREVPVHVRVLASSNRDIPTAIAQGRFRADLHYRLQGLSIHVPPLRQRPEDVPLLVDHFLASFCNRRCGCVLGVSPDALGLLAAQDWPGNVRELRNVIEHAVTTGSAPWIGVDDLPQHFAHEPPARPHDTPRTLATPREAGSEAGGSKPAELPTLAEAEAELVHVALRQCSGNKVRAARALGISRHKLYAVLGRAGEQRR